MPRIGEEEVNDSQVLCAGILEGLSKVESASGVVVGEDRDQQLFRFLALGKIHASCLGEHLSSYTAAPRIVSACAALRPR
jgi:hypothetical protein